MIGGAYSQTELQQLHDEQFSENQIQSLQIMNIPFNEIILKINQFRNNVPNDELVERVMIEITNEQLFDNIPHTDDNNNNSFNMDVDDLDISMDQSNGSMHLSDLNVSRDSMSANTSVADNSFGSPNASNHSMSSVFSENESFGSETGGKKRRRKTSKKARNMKKSRKQKGGMCFGNGVGANSYDPNFSIYNTRELQLFPYKPN